MQDNMRDTGLQEYINEGCTNIVNPRVDTDLGLGIFQG